MTFSGFHSIAVLGVDGCHGRPFTSARGGRRALRRVVDEACAAAGAGRHDVHRTGLGEGFVLAFHAATARADLSTRFVRALDRAVREHDEGAEPGAGFRLRIALHAGDVRFRAASWTGQALGEACELAASDVLRRVLTAAPDAVTAVAVSAGWYAATVEQGRADGTGFARVRVPLAGGGDAVAWVRVPGVARPPGLTPADTLRLPRQSHVERLLLTE